MYIWISAKHLNHILTHLLTQSVAEPLTKSKIRYIPVCFGVCYNSCFPMKQLFLAPPFHDIRCARIFFFLFKDSPGGKSIPSAALSSELFLHTKQQTCHLLQSVLTLNKAPSSQLLQSSGSFVSLQQRSALSLHRASSILTPTSAGQRWASYIFLVYVLYVN